MNTLSRRDFLKAALVGTAGVLVGCQSRKPLTVTPPPSTATPTPTVAPPLWKDLVRRYPEVKSRVVRTHHGGVWADKALVPDALRQMLDASITRLTGLNDATEAWKALFQSHEKIAIKVNTIGGSEVWTHVPLVMAVTQALQDAGIPTEQITIFDRTTAELKVDGYSINRDGPGVRCYGTDIKYTSGWQVVEQKVRLSDILLGCDALINLPVLKSHGMAGMSFALKNHYGTFDKPDAFHSGIMIQQGIAELNALPPLQERTRLIIGDALAASLVPRSGSPYWSLDAYGDAILMSFDPVAMDAIGLLTMNDLGQGSAEAIGWANSAKYLSTPWMRNAATLDLGTDDVNNMELVDQKL